ncbi:MAG: biotin--[acetyl-CoA-carboxylase] ligase [Verrucomicrobiae bacterium]|nr:biotin--[acetyl-CoA-carboxylase] ligase [Verrucomicrobiae bacterium]NNJ41947.1 biotin--[acetyl-CoA-carboxylase] ligase [Akkermansiaceae bacterium]
MFDLRQFASIAPEWYLRLRYHEALASTNDEARRLAVEGAEHGTVVLADHQSAGRGRRGSAWASDPGDGLLFSLVLRPNFEKKYWSRIALATGWGIARVLRSEWGVAAEVKWPNDLYVHGRKCAGILAEAREGFVVVGVGINVMAAPDVEMPGVGVPIAVCDVLDSPVSRERVLAAVLESVLGEVRYCAHGFDSQVARLREVCFLTGKIIKFTASGERMLGKVIGLADDGTLAVEVNGDVIQYSQAAEIRVI